MVSNAVSSSYNLGETNYSYVNTRVRAMESKLFKKDVYIKLLNMEVPQIARYIGEHEYKNEIVNLSSEYRGIELIEHALNENLANTYDKLLKMGGKKASKYTFAVLKRWDIHNIISILRGKFAKVLTKDIEKTLIPIGEIPYTFIQSLLTLTTYEDVIKKLKKIDQFSFLDEHKEIADIESELYKNYYCGVLDKFRKDKKTLFINFIKMEIDIINLRNILRMRRYGFTVEEEQKNVIDGGFYFNIEKLGELLRASDTEFLAVINKTPYGQIFESHWSEPTLFTLEEELEKFLMGYAKKQFKGEHLSIIPILHYIISKKVEVDNIRKISRGKSSNIQNKIIEESLVI
ncbi:MAG: V-type ATP synthase subunit C [Candidatus Methanofastidiosum methylothiophilum]|uniref:A-type ATP synthase subunit C n=1 Tax=Candidatus Methanofastidiosum methylothiophilum TaxID=1705564 RepID=A0A150J758_9EURY|nr:MAG: V-type ATP synthase subunit C [Candidatus Methanofastidiosum methylthiophilus]NMC77572.1 ATP synthase A1 subunit C [Candidatus Methanofastidiosa archaeon]